MNQNTKTVLGGSLAVERPRYFPRQLITPEVMILEQEYFRNRMRLHNRLLHGWGVVCGALVRPVPAQNGNGGVEPWKVVVCPGYVLGPEGDEIIIACEHEVDLRQTGLTGTAADPCGMSRDPWCSDVWIKRDPGAYYIAVKYKEIAVRPQRVQPAGCGCDENRCEFSNWRDGYEIRVLTDAEYKQTQETPPAWNELFQTPNSSNPVCWPVPAQPWVVLARLELDGDGRPTLIDNTPRRLVAALGHFWWTFETGVTIDEDQKTVTQGDQGVELTFTGEGFQKGLTVILGKGISVVKITPDASEPDKKFTVTVNVAQDAAVDGRDVMVINPDCSFARTQLEVQARAGEAAMSAREARRAQPAKAAAAEEAEAAEEGEEAEEKPKRTTRRRRG